MESSLADNDILIPLLAMLLVGQVTNDDLFSKLVLGESSGEVQPGYTYVIKEQKPKKALMHFWKKMEDGYQGLLITRQHPDHVERRHGPAELKVLWLSTTLGKSYVDPHNLGSLTNIISRFVDEGSRTVIMLDGLEYLLINNDFPRLLKFIEYINEIVMQKRGLLLISIDQRALDEREMALLERNAEVA
jgi:hypothetical protein